MCFLELCESNYKKIQLLCQVVILRPEKKNRQKLDVSSEGLLLKTLSSACFFQVVR